MSGDTMHVLITGAAGQIGYAMAFRIASGALFGESKKVVLHLLEITPALPALEGVSMELQDCAFPQLAGVICTDKPEVAFKDVDVAFLVGSSPRKDGMTRADLLEKNGGIFTGQGKALGSYAKKTVKVLVVGNPANTNCLIALHSAKPNLGPKNFAAMSRLDHNRIVGELAARLKTTPGNIKKVIMWGNHSDTQVIDCHNAELVTPQGKKKIFNELGEAVLHGEFAEKIAKRGAAVIKARGASSAASAANAAIAHMYSWIHGTPADDWVSMAIPAPADNGYGIEEGLVFSFPCQVKNGEVQIVKGLELTPWAKDKLKKTEDELKTEKKTAWERLKL